jgi:hypothetical protein
MCLPEDPAYSTPRTDRTFLFFSGRYVRDTMCSCVFIFQPFRDQFSHNLDRDFFELFSVFFLLFSTGIICQNIISKSNLSTFCELLFDFLTFLGVYVIESLIIGDKKNWNLKTSI